MDLVNSITRNSNNKKAPMEDITDGESAAELVRMAAEKTGSGQEKQTPPSGGYQVPEYLKAIGMDPRQFWPKKYRFTREKSPGVPNPMSISQRNFYESNGYIVLDDCVPRNILNAIRMEHQESDMVDEFLIDKMLIHNKALIQYVKCFSDDRVMLMTHQLVSSFQRLYKQSNKEQPPRQHLYRDWLYLPFRPIDKVVCAITALETLEHVIIVVPGTHRVGQCDISLTLESINSTYDASQEKSHQSVVRELFECAPEKLTSLIEKSKKGVKYIDLKPGQTLFYHTGLVHGFSDDLVNFNKRQLASIAYYAASDCEYVDFRNSNELMNCEIPLPINLAHFADTNPCDYRAWIGKPRLISDIKSNM